MSPWAQAITCIMATSSAQPAPARNHAKAKLAIYRGGPLRPQGTGCLHAAVTISHLAASPSSSVNSPSPLAQSNAVVGFGVTLDARFAAVPLHLETTAAHLAIHHAHHGEDLGRPRIELQAHSEGDVGSDEPVGHGDHKDDDHPWQPRRVAGPPALGPHAQRPGGKSDVGVPPKLHGNLLHRPALLVLALEELGQTGAAGPLVAEVRGALAAAIPRR
mmetsp:Transcript_47349/g.122346  ORF Transcript_47349/g.122346 Transcript_47349/m.122346 type:complete len:217 (+) Transcript_47349:253-903(+)